MTLQQFDSERVVDIHYHKGEQVSIRCVNDSGCKQLNAAIGSCGDVVVSALKVLLCLGEATVKLLTYIVPTERLRITFQMVRLVLKSIDRIVRPAFILTLYSVMTSSMSLWAKFMSLLCLHLHVDSYKQCRTFMLFDMSMRLAMLIGLVSTTSSPVDTLVSLVIRLCDGCKQPRPPIVVRHNTRRQGDVPP